jgi:hypothetical protein
MGYLGCSSIWWQISFAWRCDSWSSIIDKIQPDIRASNIRPSVAVAITAI